MKGMSRLRWFVVVVLIATPVCAGAALWGLSSHSTTPAVVAGAFVIGAAFGRPGSATNRSGRVLRGRAGFDYALLVTGAVYIGAVAGVIDFANH